MYTVPCFVDKDNEQLLSPTFLIRFFLFLIRSIAFINKQKSLASDEFITMWRDENLANQNADETYEYAHHFP